MIRDDNFVARAIAVFDLALAQTNKFVVIGPQRETAYLQPGTFDFISESGFRKLVKHREVTAIVFHYMDSYNQTKILPLVPSSKKIWWIGFGGDYYPNLIPHCGGTALIQPSTMVLVNELDKKGTKTSLRKLVAKAFQISSWINLSRRLFRIPGHILGRSSLSRIDYFSPVLERELEIIRSFHPSFAPKLIPWNYGTLEDDLGGSPKTSKAFIANQKLLIQIGHSASPYCNHAEAFEFVKKAFSEVEYQVVCPLSYGDERYGDRISELGKLLFGDDFVALRSVLPLLEYQELLRKVDILVLNSVRQMGVANVLMALNFGAIVFLNPASPVSSWLKSEGIEIEDIAPRKACTDLSWKVRLADLRVSDRELLTSFLEKRYSRVAQTDRTNSALKTIMADSLSLPST